MSVVFSTFYDSGTKPSLIPESQDIIDPKGYLPDSKPI